MKYAVVIPAKNEQNYIHKAIISIAEQKIRPEAIVVVDDSSTDNTFKIVDDLCKKYCFLNILTIKDEKKYSLGGHVVRVFNRGVNEIEKLNVHFDWIIKMDADIEFESDFISRLSKIAKKDHHGIVSGTPYYMEGDNKVYEISPEWHTHGQFKIYNRKFLIDIGGIPENLGWDTADNIIAHSKGWKTIAIRDINYKMHRKVGGKTSLKKGRKNHGIGCYLLGYSIPYFILKACHDMFKPPYFNGLFYLYVGYLQSFFNRPKKVLNKTQSKLLRRLLWKSFLSRLVKMEFILFQRLHKFNWK